VDIAAYTCMLVSYRRLSPQFQFSLSSVTLVYLSQWSQFRRGDKYTYFVLFSHLPVLKTRVNVVLHLRENFACVAI
jgi:hypothetical protein